ncbi:MAG: DinB family protein [Dehalococcoidia bacterium]|nr:DinB family protein [Dehalococcoidia bacterium]
MTFASPEIELFVTRTLRECDRIVAALGGLTRERANWRPVDGANSIAMLASHMPGNIREVLLGTVAGEAVTRDRDAEFEPGDRDPAALVAEWEKLRARVLAAFEAMPGDVLDEVREYPRRGAITVREILLVVARHAAEHAGQAELTRQLAEAAER